MVSLIKSHRELVDCIVSYLPKSPVIVEAGAFNGSDSLILARYFTTATIHAFEPVPAIYDKLVTATSHEHRIITYPIALSNTIGEATFYVAEKPEKPGIATQAGSLHRPRERLHWSPIQFPYTITVPTITLDAWAAQHHIERIDFLWLDMQGHEFAVMQAAPMMMATVRVVYTEVAFCQAYDDQLLYAQLKEWLEHLGFTEVGRNFSDASTWFFGNALFVR